MNVYADGFGRWHVILPDTRLALKWAVKAIAQEIHERDGVLTIEEVTKYVNQNIVTWDQEGTEPGFIHFAEYGPEA